MHMEKPVMIFQGLPKVESKMKDPESGKNYGNIDKKEINDYSAMS